jgi:hypothetical protein
MKTIRISLLLIVCCIGFMPRIAATERASVQGILITASNDQGNTDSRLSRYEPTLRRILRFESYRYVGEGSTSLDIPANGTIQIGNGHRLEVETEESNGRGVRLRVKWLQGNRTLMETGLTLNPGVPAVLGGPGTGSKGEVYAVILIGR